MAHLDTLAADGSYSNVGAPSIAETTHDWTIVLVVTSDAGQGITLPNAQVGDMVEVHKSHTGSADTFYVYGGVINGASGSSGVGPMSSGLFRCVYSGEWWYFAS